MGNVNMEAYQVHYRGDESVADHLHAIDNDIEKAAVLPDLPTAEGKTVLTAVTDDQGDTELTYETPEVESEDIAPEFSEDEVYSEGDLVYYEGILYKFSADHAAGTWDPSEVTPTSAAAEFVDLKSEVDELKSTLSNPFVVKSTSKYTGAQEAQAITFSSNEESSTITLNKDSLVFAIVTGKGVHYVYFGYPEANNVLVYPQTDATAINMMLLKAGTKIKATANYGISDRASEAYIRAIPIDELYSPYS